MSMDKASQRSALAVLTHDTAEGGYAPPDCRVSQPCRGDFQRANSLWIATGELPVGASLRWTGGQQDQAVFVLAGELQLAGRRCEAGDALLVEAGVECAATVLAHARIAHFGSDAQAPPADGPFGAPSPDGHSARVIKAAEAALSCSVGPDGTTYTLRFFADGSAPTSRAALFSVAIDRPSFAPPHSHSQDELIHVLEGEVSSGMLHAPAGRTLAVARDRRYSFRTETAASFLNFRRDASLITVKRGESRLETVAGRQAPS